MKPLDLHDIFTYSVVISTILTLLLWARQSMGINRNSWKKAEDVVINCEHCHTKFIANSHLKDPVCPYCSEE